MIWGLRVEGMGLRIRTPGKPDLEVFEAHVHTFFSRQQFVEFHVVGARVVPKLC